VGTREKLFHKHGRHLVLVGGLTDAFFFAPYWELLDSRLGERGWCAPSASLVCRKMHQCISQLRAASRALQCRVTSEVSS